MKNPKFLRILLTIIVMMIAIALPMLAGSTIIVGSIIPKWLMIYNFTWSALVFVFLIIYFSINIKYIFRQTIKFIKTGN